MMLTVIATVKHNFARQHIEAARYFASCSSDIEKELLLAKTKEEPRMSKQRAHVVAAVVCAVMGLEACVNEVYLDACDGSKRLAGLDKQTVALLAEWWPCLEKQRANILLKYQHALLLAGKSPMPKGQNPYQDTDSLILLRNALAHYKPEWDDSLNTHAELRNRLEGRFAPNPAAGPRSLWFPHQCLGSGCARWAVHTVEEFVSAFCTRLGIPPRF